MPRTLALAGILIVAFTFGPQIRAEEIEGVEVHMFASQGFLKSSEGIQWPITETDDGTFKFNEFGVNLSKQITSKLRIGMQLFGQARGNYGNEKVTLDWAYADYRFKDYFGVRAGKIKMPLGLYNETRDTDQLRTFILLPQGLYDDRYRETVIASSGVAVYGTTPPSKAGSLAYHFQAGGLNGDPKGGIAKQAEANFPGKVQDLELDNSDFGSLEWRTPLPGLRLAASRLSSGATATTTIVTIRLDDYTKHFFSAEYTWGNLVLAGEYGRENMNTIAGPIRRGSKAESWYSSAAYRFTDRVEVGGYYSVRYRDPKDREGDSYAAQGLFHPHNMWQKEWVASLRIDPVKHVVLKLEAHQVDGTGQVLQLTSSTPQNWWLMATKATVYF